MTYTLRFDHLDGDTRIRPLAIDGDTTADLAQAVHRHARGYLGSRRVDVQLNADTLTGSVVSHGVIVGEFTLEAVEEMATDAADEGGIKWGYTLHDLDRITRTAIRRNSAYFACDTDERYAAAWHAAVEHLYTTDTPPTTRDLTNIAWRAADQNTLRASEHRGHGRNRGDGSRSDGATVRFWAYWETISRHTASPEEPIVERLALAQIWPRLKPAHQAALQALAAHGNYQDAARSLGLRQNTFYVQIRKARTDALGLWWEGETPRRGWRDVRRTTPETQLHSVSAHIRKRRRAAVTA